MVTEKTIKSRSVQKNDTETNWKKATNFSPKSGEIIIYNKDASCDRPRIKVGDGVTNVNDLPFTDQNSLQISATQPAFACTWFRVLSTE